MRNVLKIMNDEKIITIPAAVQNRAGGSGAVAYNYVLGKPGDENLLFAINQPMFTTPIMQGTPSVVDQVVPIASFIQSELVFLVQPNAPYKSMKEFIEAAKASPGQMRIAGAQAGSTDNLATALIEKAGGVKLTYVPFDGGSAALAAFLGGNVEGTFATLEEGVPVVPGREGATAGHIVRETPDRGCLQGCSDRQGAGLRGRVRSGMGRCFAPQDRP